MFSDLLAILNLIKDAIKDLNILKASSDRTAALLEMLKTYFLMLDTYEDGIKLLESVDHDPVQYIKSLDDDAAKIHSDIWDRVLRRQSFRLWSIQDNIGTQSYLAVINPDLVKEISKVIGNKMDTVVTLHGIGAALFFRNVFSVDTSPESTATLVVEVLTKQESGVVDIQSILNELNSLKAGLDQFRELIDSVMDKKEIMALSAKARKETEIKQR